MSSFHTYCPIFRQNTETIFPDLIQDKIWGLKLKNSINKTVLYDGQFLSKIRKSSSSNNSINVKVVNMDCLEAALYLLKQENCPNVCVLNMCSDRKAGGGYPNGKAACEESVCRRTMLFHCLDDYHRNRHGEKAKMKHNNQSKPGKTRWYPLESHELIYSPEVITMRDVNNNQLKSEDYYLLSYISASAVRKPEMDYSGNYMALKTDETEMNNKLKYILRLAHSKGHRHLVLSAFGSGAFRVPAQHVGELLYSLLFNDSEFQNAFDTIYIAIIDPYLKTNNFQIYSEIFHSQKQSQEKQKSADSITNLMNQSSSFSSSSSSSSSFKSSSSIISSNNNELIKNTTPKTNNSIIYSTSKPIIIESKIINNNNNNNKNIDQRKFQYDNLLLSMKKQLNIKINLEKEYKNQGDISLLSSSFILNQNKESQNIDIDNNDNEKPRLSTSQRRRQRKQKLKRALLFQSV